jgi:hypothetical protein
MSTDRLRRELYSLRLNAIDAARRRPCERCDSLPMYMVYDHWNGESWKTNDDQPDIDISEMEAPCPVCGFRWYECDIGWIDLKVFTRLVKV